MIRRIVSILVLWLLLSIQVNASHIVGGNLGYEYQGLQPSGKYRYKIKLTTYVDCSPTSEIPYAEHPLKVGIYAHNSANPSLDKVRVDSVLLYKIDTTVYQPFLPPGCTIGANSCIIEVHYEGQIDLAPSTSGYWLFYERCCRNTAIINLQPYQSSAFLSYIPPTNIVNNSPEFLFPPIPFLCVNDTVTILNGCMDIDGDSLVYLFDVPFNGFGSPSDPLPPLPTPVLSWPVLPVDYNIGFSSVEPFAYFGSAAINNQNGIANYVSQQQGAFVICVIVQEFRNGVLISVTRRDLQLIFLNCPNNYPPQLEGNLQRDYSVTAGDSICFPVTFRDPENDSAFVEAFGDIFDPFVMDTPAVFYVTDIDSNRVSGNFCWTLPCSIDTGAYSFYLKSTDNGCPPKEKYEFYTIHVIEPVMPNLMGADSVCKGADSVLYWMVPDNHYQYAWNVINGNIVQGYGDSIVVAWDTLTAGSLYVDVFTATGCYIGSDSMEIELLDVPFLTAMPGDTVCQLDTVLLSATGGVNYYWWPETNLLNTTGGNTNAIVTNSGWYYVTGLPGYLCPPSDSVFIVAYDLPNLNASADDTLFCYGDTVSLSSSGTNSYHWEPNNLVLHPDSANTLAYANLNGQFIVTGIDSNQCKNADTIFVQIHPIPAWDVTGEFQICFGDTATLTASGGVFYNWSPGSFIFPDTGATVIAIPDVSTMVHLEITDTNGCKLDTILTISVNDPPLPGFSFDTLKLDCSGTWIKFNNVSQGADHYEWLFGNGAYSDEVNPNVIYPFGQIYIVQLTVYDAIGCHATLVDTIQTDSLQSLVGFNHVNVFTPDDNGVNDLLNFNLPQEFLECSKVLVYNRWGTLVYESDGTNLSWDGKSKGKKVQEGIYYWIVEINGLQFPGFVEVFD